MAAKVRIRIVALGRRWVSRPPYSHVERGVVVSFGEADREPLRDAHGEGWGARHEEDLWQRVVAIATRRLIGKHLVHNVDADERLAPEAKKVLQQRRDLGQQSDLRN